MKLLLITTCLVTSGLGLVSPATWLYNEDRPLIIANQGSSGHYPENSKPAITDAFLNGADFIEFSLQVSADKALIVNHDLCLSNSTDAFA